MNEGRGILLTAVFTIVAIFLPYSIGFGPKNEIIEVTSVVHNKTFRLLLASSVGIGTVPFLESLFDICDLPFDFLLPKWMLLLALVIPNIIVLRKADDTLLCACALHAREVMTFSALVSYTGITDKNKIMRRGAMLIVIVYCLGMILNIYFFLWPQDGLILTSRVPIILAYVGVFFICLYQASKYKCGTKNLDDFSYSAFYILSSFIAAISRVIVTIIYGSLRVRQSVNFLSWITVINVVTSLFASIIPGRVARHNATALKVYQFITTY
jgi:hypothetical protein